MARRALKEVVGHELPFQKWLVWIDYREHTAPAVVTGSWGRNRFLGNRSEKVFGA